MDNKDNMEKNNSNDSNNSNVSNVSNDSNNSNNSNNSNEIKYLQQLNDLEKKAMQIAQEHLGTSYNLLKSVGYIQLLEKAMQKTIVKPDGKV